MTTTTVVESFDVLADDGLGVLLRLEDPAIVDSDLALQFAPVRWRLVPGGNAFEGPCRCQFES